MRRDTLYMQQWLILIKMVYDTEMKFLKKALVLTGWCLYELFIWKAGRDNTRDGKRTVISL